MNKAQDPRRLRKKEADVALTRPDLSTERSDQRSLNALLGRGLFETVIVAVGVFLALVVNEWRERSEQRQLAQEARAALHSELLANREAVLSRFRRTSELYVQIPAHPDQIAQFVNERRNRPIQVTDAAWTMTVETGAIRWLEPPERTVIADVYNAYDRMREVVSEELIRWTELAAFPARPASGEMREERDRAIRVWRAFAQRAQMSQCVNAGRHERALGAQVTIQQISDFCAQGVASSRSCLHLSRMEETRLA